MKVLCIGSSNYEITCPINGEIKETDYINVSEKYECGGGSAGNVAYLLGKWGLETYIASLVGSDDFAQKIKKEYEAIGVKTDFIETAFDKGTSQTIILLNKTNKNNIVLNLSNNAILKKYSFGIDCDMVITDGVDYNASLAAFDKYPNALSILTINDVNNVNLEIGKFVKYIIFNKRSAEKISNIKINYEDSATLVNLFNVLKQKYNNSEIIVTLGERGCIYAINGQVKVMPPIRCETIDTFGAGNIFVGAFAYAMIRNFGYEKSIAYATIAASLSTTKITSRLSIPSLIEVSNYYDSKFGVENNPNKVNENIVNLNVQESGNTNDNQENV